jgi:hypothetical protein
MRGTIRLAPVVAATVLLFVNAARGEENALQFDGTDDRVQAGLPSLFTDLGNQSFSVSFWLRPDASGTTQRAFFAQGSSTQFASIMLNPVLVPYFYVGRGSGTVGMTTGVSLPSGTWSHLTGTWNATTGTSRIYVDGVEAPVSNGGSSSTGTSGVMTLGARTDGQQALNGAIDGFRVWSTVLDANQVRAESGSTCGAGAPLAVAYDFNMGIAGGNNLGLTTLPDVGSGGLDGTLMNFALTGATSNWIQSTVTRSVPALVFDPPLPAVLSTGEDGSGYSGTVRLAAPPSGDVHVDFASSNTGEGIAVPVSVDFLANQWDSPQPVSIVGVDDAVVDGPVAYSMGISMQSADACYAALTLAVPAINADFDFATVAVSGVVQAEGDAGTSAFVFDLSLAEAVPGGFSVAVETIDGTAVAGTDYAPTSTTVSFAGNAGEVQHVSVPVNGNLIAQGDRTFTLRATSASNPQVVLDPDQAAGVIVDDDVDVGISLSDGVTAVTPGQALTYQMVVTNHSPTLPGTVHVVFGTSPSLLDVSWTCVALGGAICASSGSGILDEAVTLPGGGVAAFVIGATVPAFDGVPLLATAQATLAGPVDSQPGDNFANDVDTGPAGIFMDGFEQAAPKPPVR